MELEKVYEPQKIEARWAAQWLESALYRAHPETHPQTGAARFSMAIPPPNVTGSLHMGHMLDHTIMDAAARWHRMRGEDVLWLPGTDHAGIATQLMVERLLASEGVTRQQAGREEFLRRVWEWKEKYGGRITDQMKKIGDSVDWTRERFTLSPEMSPAVIEAFVRLYERGLICRGVYMVNWCPRCQTAISDLETVHEESEGSLWHIRYPVAGGDSDGAPGDMPRYLIVATTRPETMVGDSAVAINAADERYFHLHGKNVLLPLMNREIPIVLDEIADPAFGSGAVKVTPAHDPNDLEVGNRHNLPRIDVIDGHAKMTAAAGAYAGLDRFAARKRIVEDLSALGLLEKIEPHRLSIGRCDRCKTVIEPLLSTQWFVRTKPLAARALAEFEAGTFRFVPENWNATYLNWMNNIRDWCISRQLWWGHRIPAWHCGACREVTVARSTPAVCAHCGSADLVQDPDVLDTWFSSGLWPFSTLGWPEETVDLKTYYPTSLLITGFDILFFWVARMIMLGFELTGETPFRQIHMHGLVRAADGSKMSKTKGNVIDPLDITARFGTDAVRISLLMGVASGTDIVYTEDKLAAARNFANKIWNASRLVFMNLSRSGIEPGIPEPGPLETLEDRWIFGELNRAAEAANRHFENHRYHEVADTFWHFFWHDFCDWYLEIKKLRLVENSGLTNDWRSLLNVFGASLRLLHPVIPFLTEELWHRLGQTESISLAPYPGGYPVDETAPRDMALLQRIVTAARTLRANLNLNTGKPVDGDLYAEDDVLALAREHSATLDKLANVRFRIAPHRRADAMMVSPGFDLSISVPASDNTAQRGRLEKEILQHEKLVADKDRQLSNEKFLQGAPVAVVDSLKEKRAEYQSQLEKSRAALASLV